MVWICAGAAIVGGIKLQSYEAARRAVEFTPVAYADSLVWRVRERRYDPPLLDALPRECVGRTSERCTLAARGVPLGIAERHGGYLSERLDRGTELYFLLRSDSLVRSTHAVLADSATDAWAEEHERQLAQASALREMNWDEYFEWRFWSDWRRRAGVALAVLAALYALSALWFWSAARSR